MPRPKLPATRKRRKRVTVHLTDDEWRAVQSVAGGQSISDYMRELIRAALNIRPDREED